jgi:hypothetical protein
MDSFVIDCTLRAFTEDLFPDKLREAAETLVRFNNLNDPIFVTLRSEEGKLELEIAEEEDEETLIASAIFTPNQISRNNVLKFFLFLCRYKVRKGVYNFSPRTYPPS